MKTWISVALLAFVCFFKNGECTVNSWTSPTISTGTGGNGALTSTVDDGLTAVAGAITIVAVSDHAGGVTAYNEVSQTPTGGTAVDFSIAAGTGVVTIASGTASYATAPVYTLVVTATDADGIATATITLSINDSPGFSSSQYAYCIADASAIGTTLTTLTATDVVNSGSLTYTYASGNTNTDWNIGANTGLISTARVLAASTTGGYTLVLNAADSTLTGSTTIWIAVSSSCCSGATAVVVGSITLLMTLMAHLY